MIFQAMVALEGAMAALEEAMAVLEEAMVVTDQDMADFMVDITKNKFNFDT
jgi:hypothetical protein